MKILEEVRRKLLSGDYTLDKWRRVLQNMKPKIQQAPPAPKKKKG